eukprot:m.233688 g.233688  ORF g.233688 m.233688 type:complete len:1200 (-) comp18906_c0_seq1:33-3632(-)
MLRVPAMDAVVERKFKHVRRRLDQLGYRQPLGVESVPLVEKLFSDLLHTTESLKNIKAHVGKKKEEHTTNWEQFVEPYQEDNARLLKEVNALHAELIKRKDAADIQVKRMQSVLRAVEHENADLRFLNTQYAQRLRIQESEAAVKAERIERLMEKNLKAVVETPEGNTQQLATRRQRMQLSSFAPPAAKSSSPQPPEETPSRKTINLLKLSDIQTAKLEDTIKSLLEEKSTVDARMAALQAQVERRDTEIQRLSHLLEGGRPVETLFEESRKVADDRKLALMVTQVEFLQQTNKALEAELLQITSHSEGLAIKAVDLEAKNARLIAELESFDGFSKEAQAQSEAAKAEAERELEREKTKVAKQQQAAKEKAKQIHKLQQENLKLVGEKKRVAGTLAKAEAEIKRLHTELKSLQQNNSFLNQKVTSLQDQSQAPAAQSTSRPSGIPTRKSDTSRARPVATLSTSEHGRQPAQNSAAVKELESQLAELASSNRKLQSVFQSVESEREDLKAELQLARQHVQTQAAQAQRHESDPDILAHKHRLEDLSRQVGSMAAEIATLQQERDNILSLYRQSSNELTRLRVSSGSQDRTCASCVERQRQIEHLQSQLVLQPHLLAQQQLHRLSEDSGASMVDRVHELEQEREELAVMVASLRTVTSQLEETNRSTEMDLQTAQRGVEAKNAEVDQLKALLSQMQLARDDTLQQQEPSHPTRRRPQHNTTKHSDTSQLESQLLAERTAHEAARNALRELDAERDHLQADLDLQVERVAAITEASRQQAEERLHQRNQIEQLKAVVREAQTSLEEKDMEIHSLRRQVNDGMSAMDQLQQKLAEQREEQDVSRTDLDTMASENQALHAELAEALEAKSELSALLEQSSSQISYIEDQIRQKQEEKQSLMATLKALTDEKSQLESHASMVLEENSDAHMTLRGCELRIEELQAELQSSSEREVQLRIELHAASTRNAELAHTVAEKEAQLRRTLQENESLSADMESARLLSVSVGQSREELSQQLAAKAIECNELKAQTSQMQREIAAFKERLGVSMAKNSAMEQLVEDERSRAIRLDRVVSERGGELDEHRNETASLQQVVRDLTHQLSSLRKIKEDMEAEILRLRRQVTQHRYEKEAALQQLQQRSGTHSQEVPMTSPTTPATVSALTRRRVSDAAAQADTSSDGDSSPSVLSQHDLHNLPDTPDPEHDRS